MHAVVVLTSEMSILRKIAGVTRLDCIWNKDIRHILETNSGGYEGMKS